MAFNTKIRIDDQHVEQVVNSTLTLSGNTRYATHPNFTGDTQIIDKKYVDDNIDTATGSTIYDLQSPAAVSLGGITANSYVLTGKTANEILQDLLVPELFPTTLSDSSAFISRLPATLTYEVGTIITTLAITGTANRGSISPQYQSDSPYRSGLPNLYTFSGPSVGAPQATSAMSAVTNISNYAVTLAAQNWNVAIAYDAGVQPKGSKGTSYNSPAGAITRTSSNTTITGYYPVFYGYSATKPTAGQALLTPSTSKQILNSTGNLVINFGSSGSGFMWFAVPSASQTPKVKWVETGNEVNNGPIGASQLFESRIVVPNINSPELTQLWTNQSYDFYIGGFSGNLDTYDLRTS